MIFTSVNFRVTRFACWIHQQQGWLQIQVAKFWSSYKVFPPALYLNSICFFQLRVVAWANVVGVNLKQTFFPSSTSSSSWPFFPFMRLLDIWKIGNSLNERGLLSERWGWAAFEFKMQLCCCALKQQQKLASDIWIGKTWAQFFKYYNSSAILHSSLVERSDMPSTLNATNLLLLGTLMTYLYV